MFDSEYTEDLVTDSREALVGCWGESHCRRRRLVGNVYLKFAERTSSVKAMPASKPLGSTSLNDGQPLDDAIYHHSQHE